MNNNVDHTPAIKLLLDEPPIAISPTLCRLLGLPEAVFLQQLNFRIYANHDDHAGKWHVIEERGYRWVSWTQDGMLKDIPLGRSLSVHTRVISQLRNNGLILVEQLGKKKWNRANYYSINFSNFHQFISNGLDNSLILPRPSTPTPRKSESTQIEARNNTDSIIGKSAHLPIYRENRKEREGGNALSNIKLKLETLVGRGEKDNQEWDIRRVASIMRLLEDGRLEPDDLQKIIDNPEIRFLSRVEKFARLKVEENEKLRQKNDSDLSRKNEHEKKTLEAEKQEIFNKSCSSWLEQANQNQLMELTNIAQGIGLASINNKVRDCVISTIAGRTLGAGTTKATIQQALRQLGHT